MRYMGQFRMPQLTRPIPSLRGPSYPTPFRHGQRVIVSNDKVILKAKITDPQLNVNFDEILRSVQWGVLIEIGNQEDLDAFQADVQNWSREIVVSHSKGIWPGYIYSSARRADVFELIVRGT